MRPRDSRLRPLAALALAGLLAVACGTRTPIEEIVAAEGRVQSSAGDVTSGDANATPTDSAAPTGGDSDSVPSTTLDGSQTDTAATDTSGGATDGGTPAAGNEGGGSPDSQASGNQCTEELEPIRIGQVGGWTSIVSSILAPTRTALQVWAADTNARGGVACHPIEVISKDDGGDPSRASAAVAELVEDNEVVAIVGSQVTLTIAGFRSGVERFGVPAIGGDVQAFDWFQSPMLFPQGGDLNATVLGPVKYHVEQGKPKTGVIYCVEAKACTDANLILQEQASSVGAEHVYTSQVSTTQTDFSAQCQAARSDGAEQLFLAVDGSAVSRIVRSCFALGYRPAISGTPVAVGGDVTDDPNVQEATLALGSFIAPFTETATDAQKRYHQAMATYAPDERISGATTLAWVSGELFRHAIEGLGDRASGPITRELVLEGLGTINDNDLGGMTSPLTFSAGQANAPPNQCYFPIVLDTSGYNAPNGNQFQCL